MTFKAIIIQRNNKTVSVKMTQELYDWIQSECNKYGLKKSEFIRAIIMESKRFSN